MNLFKSVLVWIRMFFLKLFLYFEKSYVMEKADVLFGFDTQKNNVQLCISQSKSKTM